MTMRVLWAPTSRGVAAAVYDVQGRVLLVRQRYTAGWQLPGGGVGRGEAAQAAILQELAEEVGWWAEKPSFSRFIPARPAGPRRWWRSTASTARQ